MSAFIHQGFFIVAAGVVLSACASQIPKSISEAVPGASLNVAQARADTSSHAGTHVRWGGSIAAAENRASETCFEIVDHELDSSGRPQPGDRSGGRFLGCIEGFVDPAIYTKGRELTITGTLQEPVTRPIGAYPYRFPVLLADSYYLWQPRQPYSAYDRDTFGFHDPFFDPFYFSRPIVVVHPRPRQPK